VDLYNIIAVKQIETFEAVMQEAGNNPGSLGCEVCKPTVASILASLFNEHVMSKRQHHLQDTNDRFLANIQRNGTFSVVPRIPGGEITPAQLITIGKVAEKHNLYCKITGGQRIDLFGAKKKDLLEIWGELVGAGMESGHAYAKSLRTVKASDLIRHLDIGLPANLSVELRGIDLVPVWDWRQRRNGHSCRGTIQGHSCTPQTERWCLRLCSRMR
jgi:nitrite reductase (NAD(P)H)